MAQNIVMPKLGQSEEEATLIKWHKKTGDTVKKGDLLFVIETDKAALEVESFFDGVLLGIAVQEGETVPVSSTVAFIGKPGEPMPALPAKITKPPAAEPVKPATESQFKPKQKTIAEARAGAPAGAASVVPAAKSISPRARQLVKASAISADQIQGTGPNGRVTEKDVLAYLQAKHYKRLRITPAAKTLAGREGIDLLEIAQETNENNISIEAVRRAVAEKPKVMSKLRQAIARHLTQSYTTTPHFFVTVSIDVTDLLQFVKELKIANKPYSFTGFIIKAAAMSLMEYPELNSVSDGKTIRRRSRANIGLAVDIEDGLVVPVIHNAHALSLDELYRTATNLVRKARAGKLTPGELSGGTFTISNMGMLNIENFTAIINPGESAILAVASIEEKPVAREGKVVIRSMMKVTLSSDHRIVDGAMAAKYINHVKALLEDTATWENMI